MNQSKSSNGDVCEGLPLSTEEPHCWFYDKSEIHDSPSLRDGISTELETRYRREGARFIINLGNKMGMQHITVATSVVFFHRFYMSHSFKEFPRYVTACCCFFLAGKVEETPKKCKDVINVAKMLLTDAQFAQFGDDPKDEVMTLERILLKTIRFDFNVEHPYTSLLKYAKCLKGDKSKVQKMVQMAWTFINDSFCTTLCLEWEPEVIAIAVTYLAGKLCKFNVKDWTGRLSEHKHWWDMYISGLTIEFLEDICHQILDLYSTPVPQNPKDSPPPPSPTKSIHKPDQVPSSPKTSPSAEVPFGEQTSRPEPEELKLKTPKSASHNDSDESLEVTTVLPSQSNSSNEDVMYMKPSLPGMSTSCGVEKYSDSNRNTSGPVVFSPAPCGSEKLSGSKRCTPVPTIRNQSRICSVQEPGHDNVSSDSGKSYCKSADALNSDDPGKVSGPPGSLATENNASHEKIEMCSFIETVAPMPRSDSRSATYMSQNVLNAFEAVSLNPVNTTAVTPLDVNVNYPYFSAMPQPLQPPAKFLPPQLRMRLTAPPPPPNILIPPPQLRLPMQLPDVLPPPPQFQPSSLPPPQPVPTASKFPPPPPLHVRGPGPVPNPVPQSSSNITRLPPPLVRAPIPTAISPPGTAQASKPPSLPSTPLNAPKPSLSQSAPRPSFQSGFHSSPQTAHYLVRQNSPQPKLQNTSHDGTQNISHSQSQQGLLWQNLPPPPVSMADKSGSQGDSNPVPHFPEARNISSENAPSLQEPHSARHSMTPDSKHPPMHLRERGNPHELGRVGARNPYDSNVYPHFHQEANSPAAYSGISHERKYSHNDQNRRQRPRGPDEYDGHSYKSNIPAHLRLTPYPSPPGQHRFGTQRGSHHQPPSSAKPIFPNEMLHGPPRGRSPSHRNMTEPSDYDEYSER